MDAKLVNPFLGALLAILPQIGFKNVARGKVFTQSQCIDCLGVAVNVAMGNQVSGNVVFNMTEEAARGMAGTMMMGMAVASLDDMAKSAVCEMVNMIAATAVNSLGQSGFAVTLAPPALAQGTGKIKVCGSDFIGIEMTADALQFQMAIGVG